MLSQIIAYVRNVAVLAAGMSFFWTAPAEAYFDHHCWRQQDCTMCDEGECWGWVCDDGSAGVYCWD